MGHRKHFTFHIVDGRSNESVSHEKYPPSKDIQVINITSSWTMQDVVSAIEKSVTAKGGGFHSIDTIKFFGHGEPGKMEFGKGLNIDSVGSFYRLSKWMNPNANGLELHGCNTGAAYIKRDYPAWKFGSFKPRKGERDVGKELMMRLSDILAVPVTAAKDHQIADPFHRFEGPTRTVHTTWYEKYKSSLSKHQDSGSIPGGAFEGKPRFTGMSKGFNILGGSRKFSFDTNNDGKPDVSVPLLKSGNRIGFDLDKDGKLEIFVTVVKSGSKIGFDLDGDKKADLFPPLINYMGKIGFDLDGDKKPEIFPQYVNANGKIAFDLDGDGKADIFPSVMHHRGKAGFDIDGDGKIDVYATFAKSGGRVGFDLDADGKPDVFPQLLKNKGGVGFDIDGDGVIDLVPSFSITPTGSVGLDMDNNGRVDICSSGNRYMQSQRCTFDIDGDGKPDFSASIIRGTNGIGLDINGDGIPEIFPSINYGGPLQGFAGSNFRPSWMEPNNDDLPGNFDNNPNPNIYGPGGIDGNPNTPF